MWSAALRQTKKALRGFSPGHDNSVAFSSPDWQQALRFAAAGCAYNRFGPGVKEKTPEYSQHTIDKNRKRSPWPYGETCHHSDSKEPDDVRRWPPRSRVAACNGHGQEWQDIQTGMDEVHGGRVRPVGREQDWGAFSPGTCSVEGECQPEAIRGDGQVSQDSIWWE